MAASLWIRRFDPALSGFNNCGIYYRHATLFEDHVGLAQLGVKLG